VYGGPFLGHHAGGHPQPEAKEMTDCRMQIQRPVRLMTMQKDRHRSNGDVGQAQRYQNQTPPGQIKRTG